MGNVNFRHPEGLSSDRSPGPTSAFQPPPHQGVSSPPKKRVLTKFTDHKHVFYCIPLGDNPYPHHTYFAQLLGLAGGESFPDSIALVGSCAHPQPLFAFQNLIKVSRRETKDQSSKSKGLGTLSGLLRGRKGERKAVLEVVFTNCGSGGCTQGIGGGYGRSTFSTG